MASRTTDSCAVLSNGSDESCIGSSVARDDASAPYDAACAARQRIVCMRAIVQAHGRWSGTRGVRKVLATPLVQERVNFLEHIMRLLGASAIAMLFATSLFAQQPADSTKLPAVLRIP